MTFYGVFGVFCSAAKAAQSFGDSLFLLGVCRFSMPGSGSVVQAWGFIGDSSLDLGVGGHDV